MNTYLVMEKAADGVQEICVGRTKSLEEAQTMLGDYAKKWPKHELLCIWDGSKHIEITGCYSALVLGPWDGERLARFKERKQSTEEK